MMIKIFNLISSIHLGGAEVVAFNISEYCNLNHPKELKFVIVELFSSNDAYSNNKRKELHSKNIEVITLSRLSKRISLLISPISLIYYIVNQRPDIIHSHTDLPDFVLSSAMRILKLLRWKIPKIVRTIHNTELWATHNLLGKYTESSFLNDLVVGVSESSLIAYNNLRYKNNLIASYNQRVIYNGCRVPDIKETSFKIDNNKINIAFCGRFEYQKGIDVLINRILEINKSYNDKFFFHIIGSGSFKSEVLNLSVLTNNVSVYEPISNISEKLHVFNFVIMPSRFEGLVLLSIEASFSKVPVIASYAQGLDETLPPDWPLHFNLENSDELIYIFDNIINRKYDIVKLKEEAFRFVHSKFSLTKMIESYSKLYLSLYE